MDARQLAPDGARTMAMVHLAMFEAVNAVQPRYTPYAFKGRAPVGASADAAAVAAARSVLLGLFPDQREEVEAAYVASLAQLPDGPGRVAGLALGQQVAGECLALSATAPGITRRWERISDYVREVGNPRVWGGIHFRTATQVGEDMGRRIGDLAVKGWLTPVP